MIKHKTLLIVLAAAGLLMLVAFLSSTPLEKIVPPDDNDDAGAHLSAVMASGASSANPREQLLASTKSHLRDLTTRGNARQGEATLSLKDGAAYEQFLERARLAGIPILGKIDALHTVRVGTKEIDALANDLIDHASSFGEIAANFTLGAPAIPPGAQERAARTSVPLGNNLLNFLGATGDTSSWGRGVTIAVIDSGIQADPTFGTGRVQYADVGYGTGISKDPDGGHGTAVAALAAGASADAPGVAPAASILGIRVADDTGKSDIFTVAQAIVTAVDRGAQIVNVSLGGYDVTQTLLSAIDYAQSHGAVIVAAAGNDQAAQLTWPAADPRVISVGAVDAVEQQVIFSNSGPQLQITAPGYGVQTAWSDGQRVLMDGTSASSPIIAGSIAAIMSVNPGMNASDAWAVLQRYSSEAGPIGTDPDYGHGVVNLGWAMSRNDPNHVDTAISTQYYDPTTGSMDVVVQNRSSQGVSGMNLNVTVDGNQTQHPIGFLNPGAAQVVQIPVSDAQLLAAGKVQFVTELVNPTGVVDQVPNNNRKSSALVAPTTTASAGK